MIATRTGKIAAALFALLFACFLKSTILDYATEPKVLGGIDFDRPIPQAHPWTPIYYPLLLSAAFAYWIWPTKAYASLGPRIAGGIIAMFGASYFTMFISFFCATFGEFYLSLPNLTKMEILFGPVGVLLGALGGTAMFGLFFVLWFIVFTRPNPLAAGSCVRHLWADHAPDVWPRSDRARRDGPYCSAVCLSASARYRVAISGFSAECRRHSLLAAIDHGLFDLGALRRRNLQGGNRRGEGGAIIRRNEGDDIGRQVFRPRRNFCGGPGVRIGRGINAAANQGEQ